MIELIVRIKGHEALYVSLRTKKTGGYLVALRTPTGSMKTLGSMEIDEEAGIPGIVKDVIALMENQEHAQ